MDREKYNFFVACPHCKRKFGVPVGVVLKYVDRLFDQLEKRLYKGFKRAVKKNIQP